MPGRRRPFRGVSRPQRQPTNWARSCGVGHVTVPAASKAIMLTVVLSNPGINETIRRTRGILTVSSDQEARLESVVGAIGAIVINDLAVAAGAASIPGPCTDNDDDGWFMWMPFQLLSAASSLGTAASFVAAGSVPFLFDSKAMRRVQEGFSMVFMIENAHPTFGLEFDFSVSLLSSLS